MAVPKVKVTFDADLDGLKRGTASAESTVEGFGGKVEKFGKMAAAAFAAAAAAAATYAVKLGVDGVKAAIEDEQAQARLAQTLQAAAGATDKTIASTEKFISKMQLATGVADTDLRNALGRLTLSTNNVEKSQELLALALDISKARGLSLETVANALGKAYDGQTTSLGKLGIGLSSAELKTMTFQQTQDRLSQLFGGAAARNADTFQGKIDIMRQRFAEFQESVGQQVIPILMKLFDFIDQKISPAFEWLKANAIDPVTNAIMQNKDTFIGYYNFLKDNILPLIGGALMTGIKALGTAAAGIVNAVAAAIRFLEPIINAAIDGINLIIRGINLIKIGADIPLLGKLSTTPTYTGNPNLKSSGGSTSAGDISSGGIVPTPTITMPSGSSGTSSGAKAPITTTATAAQLLAANAYVNTNTLSGILAASDRPYGIDNLTFSPNQPNTTTLAGIMKASAMPTSVTINVNAPSVIDQQGFSNAVVDALNNSTYRGTRLPIA